jgi:tetratricopeptide (TPR) repeat protein
VLLPGAGLGAAAVLRQLGLAFDEDTRLRTLAPVRDHINAVHPLQAADLNTAVSHYAQIADTTGRQVGTSGGAEAAARLQAETGNITAMLTQAAADRRTQDLADALWGLAEYWRFTGVTQPQLAEIIQAAITTHGTTVQHANALFALGVLAQERSDHDTARARYEQALALYQQTGDVLGEANCIQQLGDLARDHSDHDTARARYEQALSLHQQVSDVLGEADCIRGLGDIALARSDHDTARARYEQALPLYQSIADPYSVGWTHVRLARLCPAGKERLEHWTTARQAWASIGREDLIEAAVLEFEG